MYEHMDREGHFKLSKSTITGVNVFGEENMSEATKKICKIRLLQDFEKIAFFHFWPYSALFWVLFCFFGGSFMHLGVSNHHKGYISIKFLFCTFLKFQFRPICDIFGQFAIFLALEVLGRPQGA